MSRRKESASRKIDEKRLKEAQKSLQEMQREIAPFAPREERDASTSAGPWIAEGLSYKAPSFDPVEGRHQRR